MIKSIQEDKSYFYTSEEIQRRATKRHQTHRSKILSAIYTIGLILTKPVTNGVHDILVLKRKGEGFGKELGPGGESKRFKVITAAAWLSLALVTLPLVILGIVAKQVFHPGQGRNKLVFMNAAPKDYTPPKVNEEEGLHMATYNVAWLPSPVDTIKDVINAKTRAEELATWINSHKDGKDENQLQEKDLPLFFGLQEAFDPEASKALTNGIKGLYPYAITNAGWAKTPLLGSNSGLQFHSRVPIKSAAFFPFQDLVGFGVKCSDRGVLRVELDLGEGNTAMVYITHTQAHAEYNEVRENEIKAILELMRNDRREDFRKEQNPNPNGHYYLMGDLNVSNVDDETLKQIDEHKKLRRTGGVLSDSNFYDPFLEEHDEDGTRNKSLPQFLDKDKKVTGNRKIQEDRGTFIQGADQKDRGEQGYGTATFSDGPQKTVDNCRYDYILRLALDKEYVLYKKEKPQVEGRAEIRNVLSKRLTTCAVSDHKMVSAIFKRVVTSK